MDTSVQNCPNCGKKAYIWHGNYNPGLKNPGGQWRCGNCGQLNVVEADLPKSEQPLTDETYANSEALAEQARLKDAPEDVGEDVTPQVEAYVEAVEEVQEQLVEKPQRTFAKPVTSKSTSKRK